MDRLVKFLKLLEDTLGISTKAIIDEPRIIFPSPQGADYHFEVDHDSCGEEICILLPINRNGNLS